MTVVVLVRHAKRLDKMMIPYVGEINNTVISPCGFIESTFVGRKINSISRTQNAPWNVVVSPLIRTMQTANQIMKCFDKVDPDINIDFRLIGHSDYSDHPISILNFDEKVYNRYITIPNSKPYVSNNDLPITNEPQSMMKNRFSTSLRSIIDNHKIHNKENNLMIVGHRKMFPHFCSQYGETRKILKTNTCCYVAVDLQTNEIVDINGLTFDFR